MTLQSLVLPARWVPRMLQSLTWSHRSRNRRMRVKMKHQLGSPGLIGSNQWLNRGITQYSSSATRSLKFSLVASGRSSHLVEPLKDYINEGTSSCSFDSST